MKTPRLLASLICAMALLHSGCSRQPETAGSTASPPGQKAIAVIPKGTTHIYWQSVKAGAEAAGKEFGYQIYWNGPEREDA